MVDIGGPRAGVRRGSRLRNSVPPPPRHRSRDQVAGGPNTRRRTPIEGIIGRLLAYGGQAVGEIVGRSGRSRSRRSACTRGSIIAGQPECRCSPPPARAPRRAGWHVADDVGQIFTRSAGAEGVRRAERDDHASARSWHGRPHRRVRDAGCLMPPVDQLALLIQRGPSRPSPSDRPRSRRAQAGSWRRAVRYEEKAMRGLFVRRV